MLSNHHCSARAVSSLDSRQPYQTAPCLSQPQHLYSLSEVRTLHLNRTFRHLDTSTFVSRGIRMRPKAATNAVSSSMEDSSQDHPTPSSAIELDDISEAGSFDDDGEEQDNRRKSKAPVDAKAARKANKAAVKAEARAKRSGGGMVLKACDLCSTDRDILFRCMIDETKAWKMVCKRCWPGVSGGISDGDAAHPHYHYGGTWKLHKR